MDEIWKDICGYEGLYQVSSYGRIRSIDHDVDCGLGRSRKVRGRIKKSVICKNGYAYVSLSSKSSVKTLAVHRLVAKTFIPNPLGKEDVNHINSIRHDNRCKNLEWATRSENMIHCFHVRGYRPPSGKLNKLSKPVAMMDDDGCIIKIFASAGEASESGRFKRGAIARCCRGDRKHHRGYKWSYI